MEIVSNRHNKGDEAFGNGAFRLARSTYEAALTGMETIEDMRWKSYTLWSRDWDTPVSYEIREKTTFTLKAKIAMTCLEAESLSGRP